MNGPRLEQLRIRPGVVMIGLQVWRKLRAFRAIGVIALLTEFGVVQAGTTLTRTSAFDYDTTSGLLTKEIVEPGNPSLCVVTSYTIDAVGNRTGSNTRNCNGSSGTYSGATAEAAAPAGNAGYTGTAPLTDTAPFTSRSTQTTYTADKRFVASVSNALGQTESRTYDNKLGVVTSLTGPNGLTTYWSYDDFGRKKYEQRPDGNGSQWDYDYCSGVNGGNLPCPNINGAAGAYAITSTPKASVNAAAKTTGAANGPYVRVYYDTLGREIRTETQGDNSFAASKLIYVDTKYNALGQVYQKSTPYYAGDTAYWTTYTYDTLGRVITEDRPTDTAANGAVTTVTYSGLITTTTVKVNATTTQQTKEERNYVGQVVKITDAKGGVLTRDYDPFGNLVRTTDAMGNVTSLEYDIKGRKTKMYDPDMGVWTYAYNALGELRKQKDAKAQLTEMVYDLLGRMTQRYEPGLNSTWTYDKYADNSTCNKGAGKLCEVSSTNSYSRKHTYDGYGRPSTTTTTIDTKVLTASVAYDANGRISSQTYPGGLSVSNVYSSTLGYLQQVKDARTGGAALWTAMANRTALGQLLSYQYGNSVTTTNAYYAPTGRLNTTQAGTGNAVQNLSHSYNYIGGLTQRLDVLTGVTASYGYDELNRLLNETRSGGGLPSAQVISWTYDAIGNMTTRTESGATNTYNYNTSGSGSLRPHAVANVSGTVNGYAAPIYVYDGNGNLTSGAGRTVTWTSYDKVETITKGSTALAYKYDSEHERSQEVYTLNGVKQRTTTYLNPGAGAGLFYEEEKNELTSVTKKKFYVSAPSGTIALITCTVADCSLPANTTAQYWHKDHLGTTSVITDASGTVIERLAYEPFGKRRNSNGVTDPNGTLIATNTDRGFTGHEHMEEVGLVNMNGRVFDPGLGRFLSADPIIQSPSSLQSYNRYSYVWNNPINSIDPSGYWSPWRHIKKELQFSVAPTVNNFNSWNSSGPRNDVSRWAAAWEDFGKNPSGHNGMRLMQNQPGQREIDGYVMTHRWAYSFGQIAVTAATWVSCYGCGGAAWAAYYNYYSTGSLEQSGKVGVITWATTYVTYQLANSGWNPFIKILTQGVVGGVSAELQGGDFNKAARLSLLTASASEFYKTVVGYEPDANAGNDAMMKNDDTMPIRGANNIGFQGGAVIDGVPGIPECGFCEGGVYSRILNRVPGVNAVAGMHDFFQVQLGAIGDSARNVFNVPGMPIAAVLTYGALLTGAPIVSLSLDR